MSVVVVSGLRLRLVVPRVKSHVELGKPCSCTGCPVVWISQCEITFCCLCVNYFLSDFHEGVAVTDSCRAGKRTLLLSELLSGCHRPIVVPCWAKSSESLRAIVISCRYEYSGCPSAEVVPCRPKISYL